MIAFILGIFIGAGIMWYIKENGLDKISPDDDENNPGSYNNK